MLEFLASRVVRSLNTHHMIVPEEEEIYQYGLELWLSTFLGVLITVTLGLLCRQLWYALAFCAVFALVRKYSGGYHADTYWKCNTLYAANLLLVLFVLRAAGTSYPFVMHAMFLLVYLLCTFQFAPVVHPNKPLDADERCHYRRVSRILSAMLSAGVLALYFVHRPMATLLALTLFSVALSMIASSCGKGGEHV